MKIAIIIPAYNEEKRIERMLANYRIFFINKDIPFTVHFIVVANGCRDQTVAIVERIHHEEPAVSLIAIAQAGKGLALKAGFSAALAGDYDYIGFVDADMSTQPFYFYELINALIKNNYDGIIASRYMAGASVYPPRPKIKRWGSRFVYEPLVRLLFGLHYHDLQCGAKLFKRTVIEKVTPHLSVAQWAFDLELLYLCKRFGFVIHEQPTVWYDAAESKLRIASSGWHIISGMVKLRLKYSPFAAFF